METKVVDGVEYIKVRELVTIHTQSNESTCTGCVGDNDGDLCGDLSYCSAILVNGMQGMIWIHNTPKSKGAYAAKLLEAT